MLLEIIKDTGTIPAGGVPQKNILSWLRNKDGDNYFIISLKIELNFLLNYLKKQTSIIKELFLKLDVGFIRISFTRRILLVLFL